MRRWILAASIPLLFGTLAPSQPAAALAGGGLVSRDYDFMASLQRRGGNHFCGASLVHRRWVLSAAHCVQGRQPGQFQVMMGSHKLSDPRHVYLVDKILIHPSYATKRTHDVALLRLARRAQHLPIAIATPDQRELWKPGTTSIVIGWGAELFAADSGSDQLKEVEVPVVSDRTCGSRYNTISLAKPEVRFDPRSMVCAGEETGVRDSCQGDSGGPLMVPDAGDRLIQVGVVSFGLGCGFPAFPGVYAEVGETEINEWVLDRLPR